jgi:predicted dehydrogenase
MKRIRAGVVGTGFAGSTHIQALRRLPQVEVVALAGRSTDHARASATKLGVARSYGDYREMMRDEPLDAVHICTPNQMHAEVTLAVIDARDAALSWNQERPNELWIGHRGEPDQVTLRDPTAMNPAASALSRQPPEHPEGWIDTFVNLFSDFYSAVAARAAKEPYRVARTVEAVLASNRLGAAVSVDGE